MRALLRAFVLSIVAACSLTVGPSPAGAGSPGGLSDKTITLGSSYTIAGQTGAPRAGAPRSTGSVTLSGSWNGGPAHMLVRTSTTSAGRYRLTIHVRRRGTLELRLTTPDHRLTRVALTVI